MSTERALEFVEKYGRMFSPSGSSRWLFCTGSVALERAVKDKYPDQKRMSSVYASEGTVAHKLAAKCVSDDLSPYVFVGDTIAADDETDFACKVDLEMANAVNIYVEYVLSHTPPDVEPIMSVETTLDLTHVSPYVHSGTSDCWIFQRATGHLHVFDYKHGKGIFVAVEHNTQMMIYALGVINDVVRNHGVKTSDIKRVTLHIIQPRVDNGRNPTRAWETSVDALLWFHEFILASIRDAFSESPTFAPSENRCRWCPGSALCSARAEDAMRSAQVDFNHLANHEHKKMNELVPSPIGDVFSKVPEPTLPPIALLSLTEVAAILRWQNKIEKFLSDVSAHALQMHLTGTRIPGQKLVRGRSNRAWKNEKEALAFCRKHGIDDKDLFSTPAFRTPAQIETVFKSRKINKEGLEDYVVKPLGAVKLAPVTDPRPEVDPKALAHHDFAEFKPQQENTSDE